MKRKINRVGKNTLTVSLPSKWAKNQGLKAGDEISLVEEGCNVILQAKPQEVYKRTTLKVHGSFKLVRRYILSTYRRGYDEIYLKFDDEKVLEHIQKSLNMMIGFEIVQQGSNFCVVKNIANIIETEFDSLIRRYFLVSLSLAEQCLNYFKESNPSLIKSIEMLEDTQNKIYLTLCKIIITKGQLLFKYPHFAYLIVELIEEVGDNYRDMGEYYKQKKLEISKPLLKLLEESKEYLHNIYEFYYKFNPENAEIIDKKGNEIINKCKSLLEKAVPSERMLITHIIIIAELIYKTGSPIFSLRME